MSDPKEQSPSPADERLTDRVIDGEPEAQASNDGTAGVGEDPQGESPFDLETDGH